MSEHRSGPASDAREGASRDETQNASQGPSQSASPQDDGNAERVVVVTPEGMGVAQDDDDVNPADLIEQPAKVMRIGSMIKQLLEEVRNAPLDEAGRARLAQVHHRSIQELKDGLAPELVEELNRITLPFGENAPSDAELRIAQAQLVGWLEGLFHGIQTALVAQQMAAQAQLQQMRRALPPGSIHPAGPLMPGQQSPRPPGAPGAQRPPGEEGTGQYL